jgi:two-component system nitrogen regulation response regulator GlnG
VSNDSDELAGSRAETQTCADGESRPAAAALLVPGLTVLWHPDPGRVGERAALGALASGREERLSRQEPTFASPGVCGPRPLGDPYLSRRPIRLAAGGTPGAVRLLCGETRTAVEVDGEPVSGALELDAAAVERGVVLLLAGRVALVLSLVDPVGAPRLPDFGLVGESPPMLRLRQEIERVAGLSVPVLLRGATGTGKEIVARALHGAGPRRRRPFLALNMGAIPPSLAAAELFGVARGAYTGAERARSGHFARASGGTLFLDEIGEAPPEVQVLLLRALECGEIQPVGAEEAVAVDVRLIAATDSDLEAAIAADRFRAPLLHRLSGYEIVLPPLARRREDVGRLALHFLARELAALGESGRLAPPPRPDGQPWLPAAVMASLARYSWPGNVRQLANVVRRLAIAGRAAGTVRLDDETTALLAERPPQPAPGPPAPSASAERPSGRRAGAGSDAGTGPGPGDARSAHPAAARAPDRAAGGRGYRDPTEVSEDELIAALRANRWRPQAAAAQLGISRPSLYARIERSARIRKATDLGNDDIEQAARECGGDVQAMAAILEVSPAGLARRMKRLGLA